MIFNSIIYTVCVMERTNGNEFKMTYSCLFHSKRLADCIAFIKQTSTTYDWKVLKKEDFLFQVIGLPSNISIHKAKNEGLLHVSFYKVDGEEVNFKDGKLV